MTLLLCNDVWINIYYNYVYNIKGRKVKIIFKNILSINLKTVHINNTVISIYLLASYSVNLNCDSKKNSFRIWQNIQATFGSNFKSMVNLGTIVITIISHNSKFFHPEIVVCLRIFTVLARPLASYGGAVWHT